MRRMNFIAVLLLLLIVSNSNGQQTNDSVSLRKCIRLCFENNDKLKQAQLETEKGKYQLKEAIGAGLPQISGYASFDDYFDIPVTMVSGELLGQAGTMIPIQLGTKYNANTGIQAGQMIYNAAFFTSVRLIRKICSINNLMLQKNREELVYNVAQLYFYIQTTDQQLALLDSNQVALQRVFRFSEQHYKNGFIRKIDLDRVIVAINNLESEKESLMLMHNNQLNMLKYLIGYQQDQPLTLTDKLDEIDIPLTSSDPTFSSQLDVQLLEQQEEQAKINLKRIQAGHIPSLAGYAGYSFQSPVEKISAFNNDDNWYTTSFVGVKLSVPIFEGNSIKNKAAQGKIEMEQIAIGQRDLKNELASNYKSAMQKLSTNRLLESKLNENRKVSGTIFAVTNEQYREGLKSFTDVLNAQAEYNVSCLSWINALFQIKTAELEILKISGNIQILFL